MKPKAKDLALAKQIKADLKKRLGDRLLEVYLYGSRARGDAHDESDMDLFLLMKTEPKYGDKADDAITDVSMNYLDDYGLLITPIAYSTGDFKRYGNLSYLREVKKGIKL